MLVLSRKIDDEILIDDNITIRVLKVKGNTVRIGVSAPQNVEIMRGELPRREIEFTLGTDNRESTPEIRFERREQQDSSTNRLAQIVSQINKSR